MIKILKLAMIIEASWYFEYFIWIGLSETMAFWCQTYNVKKTIKVFSL